ncbi:AcrR family transcriptional regulator [Thermocatellispora tengchongensis]|uniref:AcrR family transcriptional regulator n=1 Tax=Thermocatellispora tengchongensis TaxID=1073253 RepID=A0A840PJE4_9ACTN|nr:TetR/AcrR family transcriptional regulator [Thermocatellispora tengchongensis]MBB5139648.1 AcrR family transcriptional regulator [Thermocatellispora tengchongensis]
MTELGAKRGSERSEPVQRLSGAERRAQILAVARECFTEFGYQRTTTAVVAEHAGVSDSLVIKHFGSKEGLFRSAVADPVLRLIREQVAQNRPLAQSGLDVVVGYQETANFVRNLLAVIRAERGIFRAMASTMYEFPALAGEIRDLIAGHLDELATSLDNLGRPAPFRPHSGRTVTYTVVGGAIVAAVFHDDPDTYANELTDMLFFGLLSPSGRRSLRSRMSS